MDVEKRVQLIFRSADNANMKISQALRMVLSGSAATVISDMQRQHDKLAEEHEALLSMLERVIPYVNTKVVDGATANTQEVKHAYLNTMALRLVERCRARQQEVQNAKD